MARAVDLSGRQFGRLTALAFVRVEGQKRIWTARCACGATLDVRGESLTSGNTTSCGCARRDNAERLKLRHGQARQDGRRTAEYRTWKGMVNRCHCPSSSCFYKYGALGVRVCDEWRASFEAFFEHVGPKPSPRHSIDRVDPFGNYEPGNVRWATAREQRMNQRKSRRK